MPRTTFPMLNSDKCKMQPSTFKLLANSHIPKTSWRMYNTLYMKQKSTNVIFDKILGTKKGRICLNAMFMTHDVHFVSMFMMFTLFQCLLCSHCFNVYYVHIVSMFMMFTLLQCFHIVSGNVYNVRIFSGKG